MENLETVFVLRWDTKSVPALDGTTQGTLGVFRTLESATALGQVHYAATKGTASMVWRAYGEGKDARYFCQPHGWWRYFIEQYRVQD